MSIIGLLLNKSFASIINNYNMVKFISVHVCRTVQRVRVMRCVKRCVGGGNALAGMRLN